MRQESWGRCCHKVVLCFWSNEIATSHDRFPPKGSGLEGKSQKISGKSRLVKCYDLARCFVVLSLRVRRQSLMIVSKFNGGKTVSSCTVKNRHVECLECYLAGSSFDMCWIQMA